MAFVRVEQRNAHLAGPVRLDFVNGREGKVAKATLTAISNIRRGSSDERAEESTAVQRTLWGRQAENAAEYLGKGSHVNIVGRLRNNNYKDGEGADVYALTFTAEEVDYLDSRAQSESREARRVGATDTHSGDIGATLPPGNGSAANAASVPGHPPNRSRKAGTDRQSPHAGA